MNNSGKFLLGAAVGLLVGSAVVYFLDADKRKAFVKSVGESADKAKDSVVEGYYEARERYEKYRDMLKKKAGQMSEEIDDKVSEASTKAKKSLDQGVEKAREIVDKIKEK